MTLSWWPVVLVDIFGSVSCLVIGFWSIGYSWSWYREKDDDAFRHYLFLLTIAIATFTISRSFGHIVKQFLLLSGDPKLWKEIAPFSGGVNTATFVVIFAFGIYFDRVRQIKLRADHDAVSLATARAKVDAALEAEVRLRTVFDGVEDAIYLVDDEYKVLFFNRKMTDLLPSIVIGEKCYETLFQRDCPCEHCRFSGLHLGESFSCESEWPLIAKKINITGIRLSWVDHHEANLAVIRDITEPKRLEAQLLQSQKLEAVGTLAGGIAHDFNNLLTAITGYSDMLLLKMEQESPLRGDVSEIRRAAGRAAALVRQLLAFSRKQKGALSIIEINALLQNMQKMLERLIGEDIDIDIQLAGEELPVRADPGQLEQVAVNLVVNARDAMPDGGRITIRTEGVSIGGRFNPQHANAVTGRFALMSFRDQGAWHGKRGDE